MGQLDDDTLPETEGSRFIAAFRATVQNNSSLAASTKARALDSVKTLVKTWPELPSRDIRRLTASDCAAWATKVLREGSGFVAPNVRTKRKGMSPSGFNKCVDALRAIMEIAREQGMIYKNPASDVSKAPNRRKHLELPSAVQFQAIDCAHCHRHGCAQIGLPENWSQSNEPPRSQTSLRDAVHRVRS